MTLPQSSPLLSRNHWASTSLLALSLLALVDSAFEFVSPANGIHGTEGALLVVVSTLLMSLAAGVLRAGWARGLIGTILRVLVFIDIWCTGVAAYFLESWILLVLMLLSLAAFMTQAIVPRRPVTMGALR